MIPQAFEGYSVLELQLGALVVTLFTTIVFLSRTKPGTVAAYELLTKTRRSLGKPEQYSGAPVPADVIRKGLECAIRAPNHFLSEPWRFRMLNAEQKEQIIGMTKFDGKKPLFQKVPQMLVVSMVPSADKWEIKALEDHAATACAVQNFMLYLASRGYATKWMTGAMGISGSDILSEVCGVDASTEHYMGVIILGASAQPLNTIHPPKRKKGLSSEIFTTF